MKLSYVALTLATLMSSCIQKKQAKDISSLSGNDASKKESVVSEVNVAVSALVHDEAPLQQEVSEPVFVKFIEKPLNLKLKSKFNVMVGKKGWCPNNPNDGIFCIGELAEDKKITGVKLLSYPSALNPVTQKCSEYACRISFVLKPEKTIKIKELQELFLKINSIDYALQFADKQSQALSSKLTLKQSIYFADKTRYAFLEGSGKNHKMSLMKHFDYFVSRDVRQDVMEVDVFSLGKVTNNDDSLCRGYNCYHDIFATKCTQQSCDLKFEKNDKNVGQANIKIYDKLGNRGKNASETSIVVTKIEVKERKINAALKQKTELFVNSSQKISLSFPYSVKALKIPIFNADLKWLSEELVPLQKGYFTLPCHEKSCELKVKTTASFKQTTLHAEVLFDEGWRRLSLSLGSKGEHNVLTAGKDSLKLQPNWVAQFKYRPYSRPLEVTQRDVSIPLKSELNQTFNVNVENFKNLYANSISMKSLSFSLPIELKLIEKNCSQESCQLSLAWQDKPKKNVVQIGMSSPNAKEELKANAAVPYFAKNIGVKNIGVPKFVLHRTPKQKQFDKVELHFAYGASLNKKNEIAQPAAFGLDTVTGYKPNMVEVKVEGINEVLKGNCQDGMDASLKGSLEKTSEKSFDFLYSCPVSFQPVSQDFSQNIEYRICHKGGNCGEWSKPFQVKVKESIIL